MNLFLLDASALVKRYTLETGAALVDHLFARATTARLMCVMVGAAEVVAALVRKRNRGLITPAIFTATLAQFSYEVLNAVGFAKLPSDNALILASIRLVIKYGINSTDAIVLHSALTVAAQARALGNHLVLVTSDQRLLKAAQAEGLLTFDPETQDQAALDALLGP
jgi:predicted nucleic acid-binding protein